MKELPHTKHHPAQMISQDFLPNLHILATPNAYKLLQNIENERKLVNPFYGANKILLPEQIKTIQRNKPTELYTHKYQCKNSKQNTDLLPGVISR